MVKKEWLFKCNLVEIVILILVLVLLVKVFSTPAMEEISKVLTEEEPSVIEETLPVEVLQEEVSPDESVEEIPIV